MLNLIQFRHAELDSASQLQRGKKSPRDHKMDSEGKKNYFFKITNDLADTFAGISASVGVPEDTSIDFE